MWAAGAAPAVWAGSPPTAAPRARRPREAPARPASAGSRRAARSPSCAEPCAELVEQLEHAGAPFGGVVEVDVEVRDALDAQRACRARAERTASPAAGPRPSPRRSAGWPMTLTQTLAWRRSGVVSTFVIVAKPIRGSATSRATIAPISCRRSSSTRSVRCGHAVPSAGRGAADGLRREALDDVAFFQVVEVGQTDAALVVRQRPRGRRRGSGGATRSGRWR